MHCFLPCLSFETPVSLKKHDVIRCDINFNTNPRFLGLLDLHTNVSKKKELCLNLQHCLFEKMNCIFEYKSMSGPDSQLNLTQKQLLSTTDVEIIEIPKRYHQTYKNINLPSRETKIRNNTIQMYSSFEHTLWTDNTIDIFMQEKFPQFYIDFVKFTTIQKVDFVRYAWMYTYGGIYSDLDILYLKCIPVEFINANVILMQREWTYPEDKTITTSVHNCWFASSPGHMFWMIIMDEIISKFHKGENNVFNLTGPNSISEIITRLKLVERFQDVKLLDAHHIFQKGRSKHLGNKSFIKHLCFGSWKDNNKSKTLFVPDSQTNHETIFTHVYETSRWGNNLNSEYKGSSGTGSAVKFNEMEYIPFLQTFIKKNNIKSIGDLGCGDWRCGKLIYDSLNINYTGYDVYSKLITRNQHNFPQYKFKHLDFFNFPKYISFADTLIIKDVLQHWTNDEIIKFLSYIILNQKCKWIILCNSNNQTSLNRRIKTGAWHPLSSTMEPLKFFNPHKLLTYNSKEVCAIYIDDNLVKNVNVLQRSLKLSSDNEQKKNNSLQEYYEKFNDYKHTVIYDFKLRNGGIGDCIKFFVFLLQICINEKKKLRYLVNNTYLEKYIRLQNDGMYITYEELKELKKMKYSYEIKTPYDYHNGFSFSKLYLPINQIFTFAPLVINNSNTLMPLMNTNQEYISIHLRMGDKFLETNRKFIQCKDDERPFDEQKLHKFINKNSDKCIMFFCDNNTFKQKIKLAHDFIFITNCNIGHTSHANTTEKQVLDAVTEFFILTQSQEIFLTSYSGFPIVASKFNNISYTYIHHII